ncbi:MAG: 4a-hydroxytetrahydrobiopterin dehydratase [Alkalinema sp. RL_2_19]|nr:4a-hydroxytetrahydrobiopterin dehydratase [Alkalinema sp. RL_2_19]
MSTTVLPTAEITQQLSQISGWEVKAGKLHRQFKFDDFVAAFGFMASMAIVSESMGHHPEWFNVYNQVTVDLTTHDAGGLTQKDLDWAKQANKIVA